MALNKNEINPLGVLGMRKLSFIPKHFKCLDIKNADFKLIEHWINFNLNSRYAIQKRVTLIDNVICYVTTIGMEDPKEITMLILGCPYVHNKKELL